MLHYFALHWLAVLPLLLLLAVAVWGGIIQKKCPIIPPADPQWPEAENPSLALELAGSPEGVDAMLGTAGSKCAEENRASAIRVQKLDFVLIALYTAFFAVSALSMASVESAIPVFLLAGITAISDVLEDVQIMGMVQRREGSSARRFGRLKWLFYFATIAAEGVLLLLPARAELSARSIAGILFGFLLISNAIGGIISALKISFNGILSATKLSFFSLLILSLAPLILGASFSWREVIPYAVLMRVPLLFAVLLFALPFLSFFTGARSLLRGLFDLTPMSLFVVSLTTLAAARTVCVTGMLVLSHAFERFGVVRSPLPGATALMVIMVVLSLPVIVLAVIFSIRQKRGTSGIVVAALLALACGAGAAKFLDDNGAVIAQRLLAGSRSAQWLTAAAGTRLFDGYLTGTGDAFQIYPDHLSAAAAFFAVILLYAGLGVYGYKKLGKARTVPALASALMLMMMLCWFLAGAAFFFDRWRVPLLLLVLLAGTLTAQSARSDHIYTLRKRTSNFPAPDPRAVINASGVERVVVVAANGGGIQAGAWAARVLQGLDERSPRDFRRALRMISSVSGGSMGTAFFVNWLAHPAESRSPAEAAAESSLDEVAWGLGWTDFLRGLLPWVFGPLIGRGRALERAWCLNSARDGSPRGILDRPLSDWNQLAASGQIPAVVLNATVAETGERLLLATTSIRQMDSKRDASRDASDLHRINGEPWDVGVVTAARLSASFPYVTPAARSDGKGLQPHIVDGGYYDNYGMATLVEWLDEALTGQALVKSVLVVQVHGAPVDRDPSVKLHPKGRGWFYQAFAPLTTLAAVRSAGQIAHNDIELRLLQQKYLAAGIPVHTVTFEFPNPDAPLSWHLTREEIASIEEVWASKMGPCGDLVARFLGGHDDLNCGCPGCARGLAAGRGA